MKLRNKLTMASITQSMASIVTTGIVLFVVAGVLMSGWSPEQLRQFPGIATMAGLMLGLLLLYFWIARVADQRVKEAAEDPIELLRRRIQRVNSAFTEAAALMDELRRSLEAQETAREALVAEAERQQQLLAIDQEQAEKIRQILVSETKETIRAERRQQWMFFALGFAASALASIPIGIWVNSIS
ncbi:hypothetical protein [Streptosporangium sp. NPDC001681]|uniref:hypothetical protein n=1 Tax=Streptosporangium sp. NPDC001681 TaxID=3154395 RepID=UPI0033325CBE